MYVKYGFWWFVWLGLSDRVREGGGLGGVLWVIIKVLVVFSSEF